jgi:hypothetical protein
MTLEQIAQVTHEANRAWCAANGDFSLSVWDEAPQWQRESVLDGVLFHLRNPLADDSASHENWMARKVADGWKYGPVKDPARKEHPCMMPFAELPEVQQKKDSLFRAVVHALR